MVGLQLAIVLVNGYFLFGLQIVIYIKLVLSISHSKTLNSQFTSYYNRKEKIIKQLFTFQTLETANVWHFLLGRLINSKYIVAVVCVTFENEAQCLNEMYCIHIKLPKHQNVWRFIFCALTNHFSTLWNQII